MALRPSLTRGLPLRLRLRADTGLIPRTSQGFLPIGRIRYRFATRHSHFVAIDTASIHCTAIINSCGTVAHADHRSPRRCWAIDLGVHHALSTRRVAPRGLPSPRVHSRGAVAQWFERWTHNAGEVTARNESDRGVPRPTSSTRVENRNGVAVPGFLQVVVRDRRGPILGVPLA